MLLYKLFIEYWNSKKLFNINYGANFNEYLPGFICTTQTSNFLAVALLCRASFWLLISNFSYITHCKILLINNMQIIKIIHIDNSPLASQKHLIVPLKCSDFTLALILRAFVPFHFLEKVAFAPFLRRSPSCRREYCTKQLSIS